MSTYNQIKQWQNKMLIELVDGIFFYDAFKLET